jgi:hypothetical protein
LRIDANHAETERHHEVQLTRHDASSGRHDGFVKKRDLSPPDSDDAEQNLVRLFAPSSDVRRQADA